MANANVHVMCSVISDLSCYTTVKIIVYRTRGERTCECEARGHDWLHLVNFPTTTKGLLILKHSPVFYGLLPVLFVLFCSVFLSLSSFVPLTHGTNVLI